MDLYIYIAYSWECALQRGIEKSRWYSLCYLLWLTVARCPLSSSFHVAQSRACRRTPWISRAAGWRTDTWSTRPRDTTAAAASLAVRTRTSDFQTLRHFLMVSALNTYWGTSGSCPRFTLAGDCIRPPIPTSWFLPHAGLHLATAHSRWLSWLAGSPAMTPLQ